MKGHHFRFLQWFQTLVSQGGSQDRTNEPSSHAGKRKPGLEVNEEPRNSKREKADDHQRDETDGACFIKK